MKKWTFYLATLYLLCFVAPYPANAEETANNNLPTTPDTGSPEEDFSAGGTRDSGLLTQVCGENGQKIAYLLGHKNREFTVSAHPTFWFYLPLNTKRVKQMKFVLKELETDKQIYSHTLQITSKVDTVGITIPPEEKYALAPNVNYSWNLEVDCVGENEEPFVALEGWLHRLPLDSNLQHQLATVSQEDRYQVYLQNNLLYDALNHLAQRRMKQPNNSQLATAWNQLLTELGWQNLVKQSAAKPYILDTRISSDKK